MINLTKKRNHLCVHLQEEIASEISISYESQNQYQHQDNFTHQTDHIGFLHGFIQHH